MSAEIVARAVIAAKTKASFRVYPPTCTIKCQGLPIFRSQTARDLACLLDLNPSVLMWRCMPPAIEVDGISYVADFMVLTEDGKSWLFDAPDRSSKGVQQSIREAALALELRYRLLEPEEVYDGYRLSNAKDLLRYGVHRATLDDRLRLLAALDEQGALTVFDCLSAIRESNPTAALASMILQGFLEVDLDGAMIGPSTTVRRIRR